MNIDFLNISNFTIYQEQVAMTGCNITKQCAQYVMVNIFPKYTTFYASGIILCLMVLSDDIELTKKIKEKNWFKFLWEMLKYFCVTFVLVFCIQMLIIGMRA